MVISVMRILYLPLSSGRWPPLIGASYRIFAVTPWVWTFSGSAALRLACAASRQDDRISARIVFPPPIDGQERAPVSCAPARRSSTELLLAIRGQGRNHSFSMKYGQYCP